MDKLSHGARILRLREMLDTRPFVTIAELQATFGVCRKTVYNDLKVLDEAHVPLCTETGPSGEVRYKLEWGAKKKTITLSNGQVIPLGLAQLALSFLDGTYVHEQLTEVVDKLAEGASPATRQHLADLGKKVAIVPHGPKTYRAKADVLDDLITGLFNNQRVEIRYRGASKKLTTHVIEPLSLVLYREALYLIATSRTFDGLRISFAVDRITRSTWLKGQRFTYPADYSPAQHFDGAFGLVSGDQEEVQILFDPEQAAYVRERRWHPSQRFETLPDGRVRMTMTVSGTQDVYYWLLGHTGTFEVVAPEGLRERVKAALDRGVGQHEGGVAPRSRSGSKSPRKAVGARRG